MAKKKLEAVPAQSVTPTAQDPVTAPRSSKDIQTEFSQLAFRAGNLQYELVQKKADLELINNSMRSLSFEFVKVQAEERAEEAQKQAEAAKKQADEAVAK